MRKNAFPMIAAAAALFVVPGIAMPEIASAQNFSQGYQFLEAVREEEGDKVTDMVSKAGQRIINTRDDKTGEGAVHIVTKRSDGTYLRFLLAKGANPDLRDARGNTPAILAVESSFSAGIDTLITYKADLNLANTSGETPLIRAVQLRNVDMVRRLLDGGANPDKADVIAGMSARDYAKRDTRTPAILKLIEGAPERSTQAVSGPTL